MPAIPALLSLALGLLPEPERLAAFFANAAAAAYGDTVKVSLALWVGITPPLILSIVAVSLGTMLWVFRRRACLAEPRAGRFSFNRVYAGTLELLNRAAYLAARTQRGNCGVTWPSC